MLKHKFNIIGNTFNYTDGMPKCSVWSKESKNIEWVNDGGEGTRMLYKTTMIRIAAEYEMYHTIFGKPDSGEYNESILGKIRILMESDGITYKEIKSKIEKEFK